jgi:hypothetical protein
MNLHRGTFVSAIASAILLAACNTEQPTAGRRPGVPVRLFVGGGGQIAIAGQLFQSPTIMVTDSAGVGIAGVAVGLRASGSGSVEPSETVTGPYGVAFVSWRAGPGDDSLTASVPGLADASITSRGIDTADAVAYELKSVDPAYVVGFTSSLFLSGHLTRGAFYTSLRCNAPATCRDSGWGTYVRSDSVLHLSYDNNFWDTQYSYNEERGVFRGDTLAVDRVDAMWAPYLFTLSFVCEAGRKAACH